MFRLLACALALIPLCGAEVRAQWEFVSDSIALPAEMYAGDYAPGLSTVDVDGDGWDDLTFGSDLAGIDLYLKDSLGFHEVVVDLGLQPGECQTRGVVWADMDNDADQDLFINCQNGQDRVFRNLGGLQMQDITDSCGIMLNPPSRSYGLSLADVNRDGFLDLFVCDAPEYEPFQPNGFYLGDGAGHFTLTEWGLPQDRFRASHQSRFFDINGDDLLDLYVLNDREHQANELYLGTDTGFVDVGEEWGLDVYTDAMGMAWIDEEHDNRLEVYMTGIDEAFFMKDTGGFSFVDYAPEYGMPTELVTGWSIVGADFDNDGWEDLYVNSSHALVYPVPPSLEPQINVWMHNEQGTGWLDRSSELPAEAQFAEVFVMAPADWNQDGVVDLAALEVGSDALLLEGQPQSGHWLEVQPRGTESNRDGTGTRVIAYVTDESGEVIRRERQSSCGQGFLAQYTRWLHFGLGEAAVIDSLELRWPLGQVEMLYDVAVDQRLLLIEGDNAPPCAALDTYTPSLCNCPADLNGDALVGSSDLLMALSSFGEAAAGIVGDVDEDGIVGVNDILDLLSLYGINCLD